MPITAPGFADETSAPVPAAAPLDPAWLAAQLGVPLYQPALFMPTYPEGAVGAWRMLRSAFGLDRGYHSGAWAVAGMPGLQRRGASGQWETWMSLSPLEVESQELGCRTSRGHVVVMGLGMGWAAANIALQPAVDAVTVVERDPDVIALWELTGVARQLPPGVAAKLRIVRHDALQWRPERAVDCLVADIWLQIASDGALADVQQMQRNVQARQVFFWGQELVLAAMALRHAPADSPRWPEALELAMAEAGLPLVGGDMPEGYAAYVARVHALYAQRRLPSGHGNGSSQAEPTP